MRIRFSQRLFSLPCATLALTLAACTSLPIKPREPEVLDRAQTQAIPDAGALQTQALQNATPRVDLQKSLFAAPEVALSAPGAMAKSQGFSSQAQISAFLSQFTTPEGLEWQTRRVGTSQLLRPIEAVFIRAKSQENNQAENKNNTSQNKALTILMVAGQQGNAPASTEAALEFLHRLHQGKEGWTAHVRKGTINLIVVPRANPDGFAAMWPQTANGIALDTDHLALQSAEAQTVAALIVQHRPDVVVDVGEFAARELAEPMLGGVLVQDIGLSYAAPALAHDFIIRAAHEWWEQPTLAQLAEQGWRVGPATRLVAQDGALRLVDESLEAASLAGSAALRGMVGLRLQSRGSDLDGEHAARRTHSLAQALALIVTQSAARATDWAQVRQFVERDVRAAACKGTLTLARAALVQNQTLALLPRDGQALVQRTLPQLSQAARFGQSAENKSWTRARPCGYWLSADSATAALALQRLGLQLQKVAEAEAAQIMQSYLPPQNAGAALVAQRSLVDVGAGSWYVPLNQAWAPLAVAALEPDAPQSFFSASLVAALENLGRFVNTPKLVFEGD